MNYEYLPKRAQLMQSMNQWISAFKWLFA